MTIIIRQATEEERTEMAQCPTWCCEVSTFPWHFDEEEHCWIIEGEAVVTFEDREFRFGVGDYVIFPKGMDCMWQVVHPIKKHYKHVAE